MFLEITSSLLNREFLVVYPTKIQLKTLIFVNGTDFAHRHTMHKGFCALKTGPNTPKNRRMAMNTTGRRVSTSLHLWQPGQKVPIGEAFVRPQFRHIFPMPVREDWSEP